MGDEVNAKQATSTLRRPSSGSMGDEVNAKQATSTLPRPSTAADPMEAYEEVKVLGRGAFGVATLVKFRSGGRRAKFGVIKHIDLNELAPAIREESHKEVGVLRQLTHRHIVAYYDTFMKNSTLYIVMEFADDGDLSTAIKKRREDDTPYSEVDAMTIFGQCCLALQYVHGKRIVHRDIKSQNIFMMKAGDVKLGDFGISKVMETNTAVAGTVIGTPSYFAPEICEDQPYGSKVDIWSIGVVLFELLALSLPFQASNVAALVMKIINTEPPPLPSRFREEVHDVVRRALQKIPNDRASADELLQLPAVSCTITPQEQEKAASMDQFEKIETLGRGAFGVAILVKQHSAGSSAPLRVIKTVDLRSLSADAQKGAQAEVAVLRRLAHPNIIAYFDAFVEDGQLHIVLEYADGGDLNALVRKHREEDRQFSEGEATILFGQCLLALNYIHGKRILHRDIKTQNIFLMKTGDAKLGDFGISKVMEDTLAEAATVVGTPSYLAPEICESLPYGSKVDIWSMGVVFYELMALKQPFQSSNMAATIMKIVNGDPPPLPSRCSEEVSEIVRLTLQKKPDARPSAEALLAMPLLSRHLGSAGGAFARSSGVEDQDLGSSWGGSKAVEDDDLQDSFAGTRKMPLSDGLGSATPGNDDSIRGFLEDNLFTMDSIDGLPKLDAQDLGTTMTATMAAKDELATSIQSEFQKSLGDDGNKFLQASLPSKAELLSLLEGSNFQDEAATAGKRSSSKDSVDSPADGPQLDGADLLAFRTEEDVRQQKISEKRRLADEEKKEFEEEQRRWLEQEASSVPATERPAPSKTKMSAKEKRDADKRRFEEEQRVYLLENAPEALPLPATEGIGASASSKRGGSAVRQRPREEREAADARSRQELQQAAVETHRDATMVKQKMKVMEPGSGGVVGSSAFPDAIDAHMGLAGNGSGGSTSSYGPGPHGRSMKAVAPLGPAKPALAVGEASPQRIRGAGSILAPRPASSSSSASSLLLRSGSGLERGSGSQQADASPLGLGESAGATWRISEDGPSRIEAPGRPAAGHSKSHISSEAPLRGGGGHGMNDAVRVRDAPLWLKPP
ncbi:unnamed protein product [Polarella glacialis]|uniref:non-specific serine/threonine protein kinase n=1 Tax=Polarella glacialis TaxID=89957 RepID=A0A813GP09_POLGL|nr:unnamed protein product [Polarella glacialis]